MFDLQKAPDVVSKDEICDALWGDEEPDSKVLRSHIYQLRSLIDRLLSTRTETVSTRSRLNRPQLLKVKNETIKTAKTTEFYLFFRLWRLPLLPFHFRCLNLWLKTLK